MHAELRFMNGPVAGQIVPLLQEESTVLGRAGECHIVVKAIGVSRSHCRFDFDGQDYHLVDLGSINGTFVNCERVPKHVLQHGDVVRVGQVEAIFLWEETVVRSHSGETATVPVGHLAALRGSRCDQCGAPIDAVQTEEGRKDSIDDRTYCGRCQSVGPLIGRQLANYRIESKIAHGGMGAVFKGHGVSDPTPVAIKVLSSQLSCDPGGIQRFLRGARAATQLIHPHIVRVYVVDEWNGIHYIAMEYVDGPNLLDAMSTGRLNDIHQVVRIGIQVSRALEHAFRKRIVHRDIKPSNIMLTSRNITKVTDLGLAKCMDDAGLSGITASGVSMGTLDYMPPEQITDARSVDHRGDIYSLGATLFHLLTKRTPFSSRQLVEKMQKVRSEMPPSPASINAEVPENLSQVILRSLAKSPADRYQTPRELYDALMAVREGMKQGGT